MFSNLTFRSVSGLTSISFAVEAASSTSFCDEFLSSLLVSTSIVMSTSESSPFKSSLSLKIAKFPIAKLVVDSADELFLIALLLSPSCISNEVGDFWTSNVLSALLQKNTKQQFYCFMLKKQIIVLFSLLFVNVLWIAQATFG